jgi:hypothetical protein
LKLGSSANYFDFQICPGFAPVISG